MDTVTASSGRTGELLASRSVALIGATERRGNIAGSRPIEIARSYESSLPLYQVNPRFKDNEDPLRWGSVGELPVVPDLAMVAVPADAVVGAIEEAAALGTRRFVVFGAGFGVGDATQRRRLQELTEVVEERDLTLLGPASLGIASLRRGLFATFSGAFGLGLGSGRVGLVSQSGALITMIAGYLHRAGIGLDAVVATGAQLQITVEDALASIAADSESEVRVIVCFQEEVRDADLLLNAIADAKALGRTVVFMSGGATPAGASAARSHTGAQVGSYAMLRDLVTAAGARWVKSLPELVETVRLGEGLAERELPAAGIRRVGILTNSGGAGVLASDALVSAGFAVPSLAEASAVELAGTLPDYIQPAMPLDVGDRLIREPEKLPTWTRLLSRDSSVDAVLLVITSIFRDEEKLAELAREAVAGAETPVIPVFVPPLPGESSFASSVEDAVAGLKALIAPTPAGRHEASEAQEAGGDEAHGGGRPASDPALAAIDEIEAKEMLRQAGFKLPPSAVIELPTDRDDAAPAGDDASLEGVAPPYVLKLCAPGLGQRLSRGLVIRHVERHGLGAAIELIQARRPADAAQARLLVERELPEGLDLIFAAHRDPAFGPVLVIGLGGSIAGTMGTEMWAHGGQSVDAVLAALRARSWWSTTVERNGLDAEAERACVTVAKALAELLADDPQLIEIEVNPARVVEGQVWCLDARATRRVDTAHAAEDNPEEER